MIATLLGPSLIPETRPGMAQAEVWSQPPTDGYITRADGSRFFLVATNYEGPPDRSWKMWQEGLFDAALIEQDFARAKRAGINALRIFIQDPLPADIKAGKWAKLDAVVGLARKYNLPLIITFFDYRQPDLNEVAAIDRLIAQRYANESAILAYDLRNEPHFQDLVQAIYPSGVKPPLQSDAIIKQYGERVTQEAANAWRTTDQGKALIPTRFTPAQAYYVANNYRIYLEFLGDAGAWVAARSYDVSVLDYIDSPDSAKWRPLLQALSDTLAAWIAPQLSAVRSVAPKYPITIGYSDVTLAKLGANKALSFQSVHRYPGKSTKELRLFFNLLQNLRATFPAQPLVLEEFGYSNDVNSPAVSAIYETALFLNLWKERLAGGVKWMLNDLDSGWDARQVNYGMFKADGSPKPIVVALRSLSTYIQGALDVAGSLSVDADAAAGIRYVYSARDALFVGGKDYADQRLRVQSDGPTQVFVSWSDPRNMLVSSTARAQIRLSPAALIGDPSLPASFTLEKVQQGSNVAQPFTVDGGFVAFTAEAGESYSLKLPRSLVDAKIQIVWPQGNLPVSQATKANVGVYLFQQGTSSAICTSWTPTVRLWRALNNGVEQEVGTGVRVARTSSGQTYSVWELNDVDVSAAKDPVNKYYFRASVDGALGEYDNIWSHGADARTYFPNQDVPSGIGTAAPQAVDAKIEILWPHDNLPVNKATRANIAAFLFEKGSSKSVAANWNPSVRLWRGLNNDPLQPVAVGQKETRSAGGVSFPVWTFNNVDVSAATNTANRYYFRVTVDGVPTRSNVWSHGVDARTYYPEPKIPAASGGC